MDSKTARLLGAVAGLATVGVAHAASPGAQGQALKPASYADLLEPIPNALAQLQADDAARQQAQPSAELQPVQYYDPYYRHHHHHHHSYRRRYHHHHHHHHHHHSAFIGIPGVGGVVVPR